MCKRLEQICVGDLLLFAGMWRAVSNISYSRGYGMLYFKTYPPVVVRAGDGIRSTRGRAMTLQPLVE